MPGRSLRVTRGHDVHGQDGTTYGLMLVLLIIMLKGILGKVLEPDRGEPGALWGDPPGG